MAEEEIYILVASLHKNDCHIQTGLYGFVDKEVDYAECVPVTGDLSVVIYLLSKFQKVCFPIIHLLFICWRYLTY